MRVVRFAGVVAVHEDRIVLIHERHERWGGAFWSIPSGRVEDHETPALGAARELTEETGLVVTLERLQPIGTSFTLGKENAARAWNFVTHVEDDALTVNDPDGLILEAKWFRRSEAVALLSRLPYRPLAAPVVAFLTGSAAPGSHWHFASADADPVVTAGLDARS
jgi:ADP-ribose pyrophosphatase YjhB (NUDIX family)